LWVDDDRADFAVLDFLPDVEVAEWGAADRTATGDFLSHLVGDVCAAGFGLVLVNSVDPRARPRADAREAWHKSGTIVAQLAITHSHTFLRPYKAITIGRSHLLDADAIDHHSGPSLMRKTRKTR
jgi:hypothetical protein